MHQYKSRCRVVRQTTPNETKWKSKSIKNAASWGKFTPQKSIIQFNAHPRHTTQALQAREKLSLAHYKVSRATGPAKVRSLYILSFKFYTTPYLQNDSNQI